jgi:hypothetical protein
MSLVSFLDSGFLQAPARARRADPASRPDWRTALPGFGITSGPKGCRQGALAAAPRAPAYHAGGTPALPGDSG